MANMAFLTVLVNDVDAAIAWYRDMLGFELRGDDPFEIEGMSMRWVTMGLPDDSMGITLMPPMEMPDRPADPAGNGPMVVIEVDDCAALTADLEAKGATIIQPAKEEFFGISSLIRDLDGNPYNLVTSKPHMGMPEEE